MAGNDLGSVNRFKSVGERAVRQGGFVIFFCLVLGWVMITALTKNASGFMDTAL